MKYTRVMWNEDKFRENCWNREKYQRIFIVIVSSWMKEEAAKKIERTCDALQVSSIFSQFPLLFFLNRISKVFSITLGAVSSIYVPSTLMLRSKRIFDDRVNYSCKFTDATNCYVSLNPIPYSFFSLQKRPFAFIVINFDQSFGKHRFVSLCFDSLYASLLIMQFVD